MNHREFIRFEPLENRLCLSVSAAVSDGDLIVSGDADGAVEIVAVSAGAFRVTDNGVLVADETTLTGVTDDIRIQLETSVADTNDTVTVDLGGQAIDRVYARLGGGDNTFELTNGTADGLHYRGGSGADSVSLTATIESRAQVALGAGDNDLSVSGAVGNLAVQGGSGADLVVIDESASISGGVIAKLGSGDNSLSLAGAVDGHLLVAARDGNDTVTIAETATVGKSVKLALGSGDNTATVAGQVDGSLGYDGSDGNDTVNLTASAVVTDNFFARLGDGDNTVTHAGNVGGDFRVVSLNENDTVDITDTATVGGTTSLGLGEQRQDRGGCAHALAHDASLGTLDFNGRRLGFYYRGFRR